MPVSINRSDDQEHYRQDEHTVMLLTKLIDSDPEEAKKRARMLLSQGIDTNVLAISLMDSAAPWESIARNLKEKIPESWKKELLYLMGLNIKACRQEENDRRK